MTNTAFPLLARRIVFDYLRGGNPNLSLDEVFIVWFSKTLQNWKALVATNLPDYQYYEVTYNGEEGEAYLDVYEKIHNEVIPD